MKTFYIDPTKIKVNQELGRVRKDMGNIKELADSMAAIGQIVPIVVTLRDGDFHLVDGGRRLAACIFRKSEVFCADAEGLDNIQMKAFEIEANIKRKAFTPGEEAEGMDFLHKMKVKEKASWSQEDTSKLLGISQVTVSNNLSIAKDIAQYPELKKLATKKEIKKAVKGINKTIDRVAAVKKYEESKGEDKTLFDISVLDMFKKESWENYPTDSVDILLTDPPYGIDIDENMKAMVSPSSFTYDDDKTGAVILYQLLAKESWRFVKPTGHAYVFFAPELYQVVKACFVDHGWESNHRPIIWIKNPSGQCNQPTMWPSACYEMCMYFRKPDSRIIVEGKPDWIQFNPVHADNKLHPSEKPVEMLRELIQRVALPGDVLADTFMGSGSAVEAAMLEKLVPIASDKAQECYDMTMSRIIKLEK